MTQQHSIETLSGSMFDFDAPAADTIDVRDIAAALANTCRFGGHVKRFYSVAEHAVLVYQIVRDEGFLPGVCFAALHHDSHEAYLGDIPTPLKRKLKAVAPGVYEEMAAGIDRAVGAALGVMPILFHHDAVVAADALALSYEASVLKPSGRALGQMELKVHPIDIPHDAIKCWTPEQARQTFLDAHHEARARL